MSYYDPTTSVVLDRERLVWLLCRCKHRDKDCTKDNCTKCWLFDQQKQIDERAAGFRPL